MGTEIFKVVAPIAGTFYSATSPEDPPYVRIGQKVNSGDVVGIIESMKVFTELRTKRTGTVKNILVENEDAVIKNQELFEIEIEEN